MDADAKLRNPGEITFHKPALRRGMRLAKVRYPNPEAHEQICQHTRDSNPTRYHFASTCNDPRCDAADNQDQDETRKTHASTSTHQQRNGNGCNSAHSEPGRIPAHASGLREP